MNTFGKTIGLTIFGESHGLSIGAVLDGLPSGEAIDWDAVRTEMARRAPGKNKMSTARSEKDAFEVQSGFFNGHTTGTPLCAIIRNSDQHSRDYDQLRHIMRPGHADYSGKIRYGGFNDYRGGGHFSGRLTAPLVFAGAVASQILARYGITVGSHILRLAGI
ncbi:chorismate synthase, partial [Megasphaera sp.]|uniref:chorismate synthase n=1 Tax=Megasphaera sp. TaxID=2023260 RepID=UPI00307AC01D